MSSSADCADRPAVQARIRAAWALTNPELAEQRLELLASEFDRTWPDAAGSLREGLPETLTLMRLGITGQLAKTLCKRLSESNTLLERPDGPPGVAGPASCIPGSRAPRTSVR